MIRLRRAAAADQRRIRAIIRQVRINPLGLRWQNFTLAVDEETGEVVATGQIRAHDDGSRELASIAVIPAYRGRGLARQIIEHLLAGSHRPLYLTCRSELRPLYERFGFRAVAEMEMTPYFRRLKRMARLLERLAKQEVTLLIMRLD